MESLPLTSLKRVFQSAPIHSAVQSATLPQFVLARKGPAAAHAAELEAFLRSVERNPEVFKRSIRHKRHLKRSLWSTCETPDSEDEQEGRIEIHEAKGCLLLKGRRQAHGELYSPCLSLRLTKIRTPGTWNKIFSEVWQHKLMVKELGPFGAERFDGIKDGKTFLRAGYNLDDPDFWGNVDNYVTTAVKQSGYTSAPKKLAMA
ncbi:unnamed protein product [Effrenium voratum]|uniref:Uncharacterized protein n=1 Tax=Effrenium voratum TaxID=2562239 RepID=A0AA36MKK6_9DINO|nr:unnamed protein product [Effrenium voratum]